MRILGLSPNPRWRAFVIYDISALVTLTLARSRSLKISLSRPTSVIVSIQNIIGLVCGVERKGAEFTLTVQINLSPWRGRARNRKGLLFGAQYSETVNVNENVPRFMTLQRRDCGDWCICRTNVCRLCERAHDFRQWHRCNYALRSAILGTWLHGGLARLHSDAPEAGVMHSLGRDALRPNTRLRENTIPGGYQIPSGSYSTLSTVFKAHNLTEHE